MMNCLADNIWFKVEKRIDEKIGRINSDFHDRVMEVLKDVDFDERIDTHSIVQDVLAEIDVESTVRDELRNTTFTVSVD